VKKFVREYMATSATISMRFASGRTDHGTASRKGAIPGKFSRVGIALVTTSARTHNHLAALGKYLTTINGLLAAKGFASLTLADITPGPAQLKVLVDLCHVYGLAVVFDVELPGCSTPRHRNGKDLLLLP